MKKHSQQIKEKALELWKSGKELEEISKELDIPFGTIHSWYKRQDWSIARKEQKKANAQKLTQKIAQEDAKYKINIRHAFLDNYYGNQEKKKKAKKVFEYTALTKQQDVELSHVARIDGLLTEKSEVKHKGEITHKVIPICGNMETYVPENNSNK